MKASNLVLATLTVAALAAAPALATAASAGPNSGGCSTFYCGGTNNHNEVLVTSVGR